MQTTNSVQSFKKIHNTVGKELHDDPMFFLKGVIIGCIIDPFMKFLFSIQDATMSFPKASFADFYLWANPHENDNPNISAPPIRTAERKEDAAHSFMPALVTRSL